MPISLLKSEGGLTTVSLDGRLDGTAIAEIHPEFMQKAVALKQPLLVNIAGVTFMASLCIRMLVEAAKNLKASGARLGLLNPSPLVEKTLKASGFHVVVGIYHDEAKAREELLGATPQASV